MIQEEDISIQAKSCIYATTMFQLIPLLQQLNT